MGNICTSERQDRIGELPDDILLHILSFLSIGEVFRTSALSTRWKHLCTLKYAWITTSQLQPWISAAIRCNLQELQHSLGYVPLPDNDFTLKSLIVMSDSFTQQTAQNALKLMSGICNVKSLTLSGDILKHLSLEENLQDDLPLFHRLTHLKFKFLNGIVKMGNICKIKRKDRISELPDHILLHILSFLPIRGVLRTSALSTRWKHLRTLITDIDYDDSTYGLKVHLDTNFYIARERSLIFHAHLSKFYNAIETTLISYAHIRKFVLVLMYTLVTTSPVKSWISAATKCNLQELELSLDGVLLLDNTFLA
ncbi:hypothetical protein Pint_03653 [Pistacia integerrima]|uniref:Uncharacterized protein n=1 Tax=Pistacia integerrima TaxID=434235 RepID=A0ACC0ZB07_9ROSI|nr:hypothetical protein Pint_03653 [Pistacia integerrima]